MILPDDARRRHGEKENQYSEKKEEKKRTRKMSIEFRYVCRPEGTAELGTSGDLLNKQSRQAYIFIVSSERTCVYVAIFVSGVSNNATIDQRRCNRGRDCVRVEWNRHTAGDHPVPSNESFVPHTLGPGQASWTNKRDNKAASVRQAIFQSRFNFMIFLLKAS